MKYLQRERYATEAESQFSLCLRVVCICEGQGPKSRERRQPGDFAGPSDDSAPGLNMRRNS